MHSSQAHDAGFKKALASMGSEKGFEYASVAGMRTDQAMREALTRAGAEFTNEDIQRLSRLKSETAHALIAAQPPIVPGCARLISELSGRGYTLALASSSSRRNVDTFLSATGTSSAFSVVLSGDDVRSAKPDPDIYLQALERLGASAAAAVVVEDAVAGVKAGVAAGARVIAVEGTAPADGLLAAGAERVVRGLDSLLEHLP